MLEIAGRFESRRGQWPHLSVDIKEDPKDLSDTPFTVEFGIANNSRGNRFSPLRKWGHQALQKTEFLLAAYSP